VAPKRKQFPVPVLILVLVMILIIYITTRKREEEPAPPAAGPGEYLFCLWTVENLFDDKEDPNRPRADVEFNEWLSRNPDALRAKLGKLTEALLKMNDGRGPDIIAAVEVENTRAAELLMEALNAKLSDPALHYKHVLMKEVAVGRHIAPAVITRVPVDRDRTRRLNNTQRILEAHFKVNGHQLVVIASHWTSRIEKGSEDRREKYADAIYGRYKEMYLANREIDFLVCGDFNDTPADPSVTKHLHATGSRDAVMQLTDEPRLFNLLALKRPEDGYGTLYYDRAWFIFDQIAVSPGLLDDKGWSCDPDSVRVVNTLYDPNDRAKRPWRHGGPNEKRARGYSDHFPVTVRLKVAG
jgi:endonuclease/exonuclease/phosphatase family metal-dependent hydrolase